MMIDKYDKNNHPSKLEHYSLESKIESLERTHRHDKASLTMEVEYLRSELYDLKRMYTELEYRILELENKEK